MNSTLSKIITVLTSLIYSSLLIAEPGSFFQIDTGKFPSTHKIDFPELVYKLTAYDQFSKEYLSLPSNDGVSICPG